MKQYKLGDIINWESKFDCVDKEGKLIPATISGKGIIIGFKKDGTPEIKIIPYDDNIGGL